jgi:ectoine hydroxylase-related dioxygenase (phytanoyl-CoA dioxygenase family)
VVPDVLDTDQVSAVRHALTEATAESERRGVPTRNIGIDPNHRNIRVFNLLDLSPLFIELIQHPTAIAWVHRVLSDGFLISNFTANVALPGSGSMVLHSDQSIVIPEPWLTPQALNVIWCLDDVHEANGATRYLPDSHHITRRADLPGDAADRTVPFEAAAGAIIAMDGRLWHTSGANVTEHDERALLFGYYSADFVRPQANWNTALSADTQATLSLQMRNWLGLDSGNMRLAGSIALS